MGKYFALFLIVFHLSGCTVWPKPSTGGYAANYLFTPAYQRALAAKSPCLIIFSQRLAGLIYKTHALRCTSAARCFPARMALLDEMGRRIAQEIVAGLLIAVEADLLLYEHNINEMHALSKARSCPRPLKSASWENLKMRLQ
jgi:hypothetical protein